MHEWSGTVYESPEPLFTLNISMTPFSFTPSFPHWRVVSSQTLLGAQGQGVGVGCPGNTQPGCMGLCRCMS